MNDSITRRDFLKRTSTLTASVASLGSVPPLWAIKKPERHGVGRCGRFQQTQRWLKADCFEDMAHDLRAIPRLSQAEAAFRTGKSDLHLRPVFHQKTERVEAHILVSFLSLAAR